VYISYAFDDEIKIARRPKWCKDSERIDFGQVGTLLGLLGTV
jgi:hypothetical protein